MGLTVPGICLGVATVLAWTPAPATDANVIARQGNGRGAVACQSCHGADGGGMDALAAPRLAGLDAGYLDKQLRDFAAGTRQNASMTAIAGALSADERTAIAGFYSRLPVPAARAGGATPVPDGVGEQLARRGQWSRQLPACEQCHGPAGVGVGANFPPLAGQSASYLENQLKAWRTGVRRNDPLQLMQHVSQALSPAQMRAVAQWFASLPAAPAKEAP